MKLNPDCTPEDLAALGAEAVELLCRGDIETLADRYGYALAFGRDVASAIREDLGRCLAQLAASTLAPSSADPVQAVKRFKTDAAPFAAVIECLAPTSNGRAVLVELVVTRRGADQYVALEDLSVVEGPHNNEMKPTRSDG